MSAGRAGCFAPVNARLFESRSVSDAEAPVPPLPPVWSVRFAAEVARRSAFRCVLAGELPAPPGCANRCAGEGTPRDEPVRAFAAEVVASVSMVDRFGSDAESPSERAPCTAGGRSVTRGSAAGASTARRTARIVAVEAFVDQPPHELPQCHVGIDMREQPFELLQPAVAVRVDDRLELPAPLAQRSHPIRRHRQRRIARPILSRSRPHALARDHVAGSDHAVGRRPATAPPRPGSASRPRAARARPRSSCTASWR